MHYHHTEPPEGENPPIMRTWQRMYVLVLILHALLILFFMILMRSLR